MQNENPYIQITKRICSVGELMAKANADVRNMRGRSAGEMQALLQRLKEAAEDWRRHQHPEARSGRDYKGTPDWQAYVTLKDMIAHCRPTPKFMPPKNVVYFIAMRGADRIKIGFTTDLKARIKQLCTGTPDKIDVLLTVPGTVSLERELHARFAADRLHGEWFRRSPAITEFITSQTESP